jgi:hypothetical protein
MHQTQLDVLHPAKPAKKREEQTPRAFWTGFVSVFRLFAEGSWRNRGWESQGRWEIRRPA